MVRRFASALLLTFVAVAPAARAAIQPMVLVHSGYLLDGNDQPVTNPSLAITFRIFDQNAPVNTENKLWEATCTLDVDHGHYAVGLGAECGGTLDSSILTTDQPRYLEVSVAGTELLPRMIIGTVPTAAVASNALAIDGEDLTDLDLRYVRLGGAPSDPPQSGRILIDGGVTAASLATSGDATIGGQLAATGALSAAGLTTTGDATIGGQLATTGAISAASLTTTGDATVGGGVVAGSFSGDGSKVTNLDAGQLATGTLADGRLGGTYSGQLALTNPSNDVAGSFVGDGSRLTGLSASSLASGTLADARLPADVARTGQDNAFTGKNSFSNSVGIGTLSPQAALDVAGSIRAGDVTATNGSTMLEDVYNNGHLTTFGSEYSSGAPEIGYAVTPGHDGASGGAFLSSTGLENQGRAALTMSDRGLRFYVGAPQTANVGGAATLGQVMSVDGAGNATFAGDVSATGSIRGGGSLAGMWAAQPLSDAAMSSGASWADVVDTAVTFTLDRPASVLFTYAIDVEPDGSPSSNLAQTRFVLDNAPQRTGASHYQPYSSGDSNVTLTGQLVSSLNAGSHTIKLQWENTGGPTWSSRPSWCDGYCAGRSLTVLAFYK